MPDSLYTRVAAVYRQHRLGRSVVPGHDPGYICECGWRSPERDCTWTDHPEHVADAVIRELAMRREWLVDMGYGGVELCETHEDAIERQAEMVEDWGDDPPESGVIVQHRYVTEWENDDE